MSERKIKELNYKFQVVNVKLMSAVKARDSQSTDKYLFAFLGV
jgi:hypothetical protein